MITDFRPTALAAGLALAGALVAGTPAFAASQGSVGATSTGTSDVSVTVGGRVRITRLDDIALTFSGTGDVVGSDAFCVYRNGTGIYQVTVSSDHASSADEFRATDGTSFVPYAVKYAEDLSPADGLDTISGQTHTGLTGSGTSVACGGGDNASLEVTFNETDLQALATGTYADTITLVVAPN
jgi:hypothetical protein